MCRMQEKAISAENVLRRVLVITGSKNKQRRLIESVDT